MSEIIKEGKQFWSHKCFAVGILLMMVLSYITLLINPTIGIDDTSFKLYYIDGVSPAMGRWCLFLIHKLFPLEYNPFFVEAIGLLAFCFSITLWCIVFYRMFGKQIPIAGYTIFGAVMISSPILSEVVVWYVQDGIYLGYGATALAVLFGMKAFQKELFYSQENQTRDKVSQAFKNVLERKKRIWKKQLGRLFLCSVILAIALGFYEAFIIVFFMAMVMNFLLIRLLKHQDYCSKPSVWLRNNLIIGISAVGLRTIIVNVLIKIYHLEEQKTVLRSRGLYEVLGWFDGTKSLEDFLYVIKDFFVKYYLNAVVYVPVMILVLGIGVLVVWGGYHAILKKDRWIAVSVFGIILLPWIMPILEGVATYYRSSEYVPLLTAFAVLVLIWEWEIGQKGKFLGKWLQKKGVRIIGFFFVGLLLYRQAYEMNKWLYVDAMKYNDTKRTMSAVALKLMEDYNTSKPICVIGSYQTPQSLIEKVYCPTWSKKYWLIRQLVQAIDIEIFEKYNFPQGYAAAETPQLSFIYWGATAFYQTDRELIAFWKMHGFSFTEDGNLEHYEEARKQMREQPAWPQAGSIVEMEDYIIVNFGNLE